MNHQTLPVLSILVTSQMANPSISGASREPTPFSLCKCAQWERFTISFHLHFAAGLVFQIRPIDRKDPISSSSPSPLSQQEQLSFTHMRGLQDNRGFRKILMVK